MQVRVTSRNTTKPSLYVVADDNQLEGLKNAALTRLNNQNSKLPGFRAGKAPLSLIEKRLDPNVLQQEFIELAINRLYVQALQSENLKPISQPEINIKKFVPFTQLEFEVNVEVLPKIDLPDYKKMKRAKPEVKIAKQDIDKVIESLQSQGAQKTSVTRPCKKGDEAVIDFTGVDATKKPVPGADGKDYPLLLGSNTFIPGFEENVIGLKTGDDKTFTIAFPKDYGVASLRSKKVTFNVRVKTVNELKKPEANDDFAKKVGPFKSLSDLKEDIKRQLTYERQQEASRQFENQLVADIAAKTKFEVPKVLVDDQVMRAEQDERQNLAYKGVTWQEHLKEEGVTEEEHRERNRKDAEQSVRMGLVLAAISDQEGIEVTPEDVEVRIQLLKGQYKDPKMQTELDKPENRETIENRIRTEKTLEKLTSYVSK